MHQPRSVGASSASENILDVAEQRAQLLGFNGFSYADIAAELSVTAASLHYHFPTKADLGVRLIERYTQRLRSAFKQFDEHFSDPWKRLDAYLGLYEELVSQRKLCLCCMLAAEYHTLPPPMQSELHTFFEVNEAWVTAQVRAVQPRRGKRAKLDARAIARALIGALEGVTLVSRAEGGVEAFRESAGFAMASFKQTLGAA